jgi:SAM-dependent methyltransferase
MGEHLLLQIARRLTDGSRWLLCARMLAANYRARRRFISGVIESDIGSAPRHQDVPGRIRYIRSVFEDYLRYGGLSPQALTAKSILELGPGDNFGVALLFLANGASRVVCLDKFYSRRDEAQQGQIYAQLREELEPAQRERYDDAVDLRNEVRLVPNRIRCLYGFGVGDAAQRLGDAPFDFIVSRAVLEEVHDIDEAFASMDQLLRPGGMLIHKIDLSDYAQFSGRGYSPLEFLTIPEIVYKHMSRDSGRPNRRRAGYYRDKLRELGYDSSLWITSVLNRPVTPHVKALRPEVDYGSGDIAAVEAIRPRLFPPLRGSTDEDLLTTGIFLTARKPGN